MIDPLCADILTAAHADRRDRTERHARHCIHFAVLTSPQLAAELIDRAIELRAEIAGPVRS